MIVSKLLYSSVSCLLSNDGTTKTHPLAGVMLRMMHVESAEELSIVIAATGLAENLWTLRTLATGGLQAEFVPSLERRQETEE